MDEKIGIILSFIIVMVTVSISAATRAHLSLNDHWDYFKKTFDKIYDGNETEDKRRLNWERNMHLIAEHNRKADLGFYTYRLGLNEYADLTHVEFSRSKSGILHHSMEYNSSTSVSTPLNVSDLPKEIDWRKEGYVTEVKNQKSCGGCWAFSATGSLEGQHYKKTGNLLSLSEQELIDCCSEDGCGGGLMSEAFDCIHDIGGIQTEKSYKFEGKNGKCRFKSSRVVAGLRNYTTIEQFCENCLQIAVATVGPISAAIFSKEKTFHLYKSGIYQSSDCDQPMNHGILIVGYGTENGQDYWLVKNSWGPTWGLHGYIKIARNKGNMCGISSMASFPIE